MNECQKNPDFVKRAVSRSSILTWLFDTPLTSYQRVTGLLWIFLSIRVWMTLESTPFTSFNEGFNLLYLLFWIYTTFAFFFCRSWSIPCILWNVFFILISFGSINWDYQLPFWSEMLHTILNAVLPGLILGIIIDLYPLEDEVKNQTSKIKEQSARD